MNRKIIFLIILSIFAGLNLGTVRRTEDPIRDTQTNPILYEQKKEEEKDGKKGPLMYHVKYNREDTFFVDPPYDEHEKKSSEKAATPGTNLSPDAADWWEEQPSEPLVSQPVTPPAEPASEFFVEPFSAQDKSGVGESPEQSAPPAGAENAASAKEDDYWW